jgi:hypothetical protein
MGGKEIPKSIGAVPAAPIPFPFEAIHEINERSLELLTQLARSDAHSVVLRPTLRQLLRESTPEARKRAAARAYLLIELEFRNLPWWEAVRRSPEKQFPGYSGRIPFSKRLAVPLARILLIATRQAIRADADIACLMLGSDPQVAELLSGLRITDIDRIADRQFRHLELRWADRPAIWHSLLLAATSPDPIAFREFDTRSLQLLTADLLPANPAARKQRIPNNSL